MIRYIIEAVSDVLMVKKIHAQASMNHSAAEDHWATRAWRL
jgi:hypothetical protein